MPRISFFFFYFLYKNGISKYYEKKQPSTATVVYIINKNCIFLFCFIHIVAYLVFFASGFVLCVCWSLITNIINIISHLLSGDSIQFFCFLSTVFFFFFFACVNQCSFLLSSFFFGFEFVVSINISSILF